MCGIVGYTGGRQAAPLLLEGLKRLEYRGYDSAGLALVADGRLEVHKAAGKIDRLEHELGARLPAGTAAAARSPSPTTASSRTPDRCAWRSPSGATSSARKPTPRCSRT